MVYRSAAGSVCFEVSEGHKRGLIVFLCVIMPQLQVTGGGEDEIKTEVIIILT